MGVVAVVVIAKMEMITSIKVMMEWVSSILMMIMIGVRVQLWQPNATVQTT